MRSINFEVLATLDDAYERTVSNPQNLRLESFTSSEHILENAIDRYLGWVDSALFGAQHTPPPGRATEK